MPKRTDIESILVIGAGPIVIGQACEFDYSGTQAVKALKAEGYRVILVNSGHDHDRPGTGRRHLRRADRPGDRRQDHRARTPDACLPTMGGQTALNLARARRGRHVRALWSRADRRFARGDREGGGSPAVPRRDAAHRPRDAAQRGRAQLAEAPAALAEVGLPAIIRPSYTLGGTGGGIAYNREEFEQTVANGLDASPIAEVLIEDRRLGWKSSRWRWSATGRTTASSSARSRTSTPWACIPATASPSRPR